MKQGGHLVWLWRRDSYSLIVSTYYCHRPQPLPFSMLHAEKPVGGEGLGNKISVIECLFQ